MKTYDAFFFAILFFLIGILLASFNLSLLIIAFASLFWGAIFLFLGYFKKNKNFFWISGLILFVIIGAFYYFWDNKNFKTINLPFDQKESFRGLIVSVEKGAGQKLIVSIKSPYSEQDVQYIGHTARYKGRVLIKARNYPEFHYGNLINFEGAIKALDDSSYGNYLRKERINGTIDFPKIELIKTNQGNFVKAKLLALKDKTIEVFQRVLPSEKAAFLSGLVLGEREDFSKSFKDAMSKSGTTHLVALSGYNISIIIWLVFGLFLSFFALGRRWAFILSILVIIGFITMTGGEASVVRAAIMGVIALLAKEAGRMHSFRNAIMAAAFVLVISNPKLLTFDVGFQLSFLAVIGLIYLSPIVKKLFHFKEESLFGWQDNFSSTLSAQVMVAPLLISYFSNFSFISLIANLLILSVIPLTMALGFITAFIGFILFPLASIFGWFLSILLSYEVFLIKFFGNLNFLNISSIGLLFATVYYIVLVSFMITYNKRHV